MIIFTLAISVLFVEVQGQLFESEVYKEIRQDWAPVLLLFLESEATGSSLWSWGAAIYIDRIRPLVYNPMYLMRTRPIIGIETPFSVVIHLPLQRPVFSPQKYTVITILNWETRNLSIMAIGAAAGILVPHLHKRRKNENLTWIPVFGRYRFSHVNDILKCNNFPTTAAYSLINKTDFELQTKR